MPTRASTLQGRNSIAMTREIDSRYDVIKEVGEHLDAIALINGTDINALLQELQDAQNFEGLTVVAGEIAGWDSVTKVLTVPTLQGIQGETGPQGEQGVQGIQGVQGPRGLTGAAGTNGKDGADGRAGTPGLDGLVPVLEFTLDNDGNLMYDVVGYEEGPVQEVEEW